MGTSTRGSPVLLLPLVATLFLVFLTYFRAGQSAAVEYEENVIISPYQLEALIDPLIKPYNREKAHFGCIESAETIDSEGSDTISHKLVYVAQGFNAFHKDVRILFRTHGSAKAVEALAHSKAQLGPMSRPMNAEEIGIFVSKMGYPPTPIMVAHDAVAVFVHEKNPLIGLPVETVAKIFSNKASGERIDSWGQLSLAGPCKNRKIVIYGRNVDSGTRTFFQKNVLGGKPYREDIREMPGNRAVVEGVAGGLFRDPNGIGYASIAYNMKGVRPLQLARDSHSPVIDPNYYNIQKGFYPLQRPLYIYIDKPPHKPLEPLVGEFIRFTLSRDGQILLAKGGFIPLSAPETEIELKKLLPDVKSVP